MNVRISYFFLLNKFELNKIYITYIIHKRNKLVLLIFLMRIETVHSVKWNILKNFRYIISLRKIVLECESFWTYRVLRATGAHVEKAVLFRWVFGGDFFLLTLALPTDGRKWSARLNGRCAGEHYTRRKRKSMPYVRKA